MTIQVTVSADAETLRVYCRSRMKLVIAVHLVERIDRPVNVTAHLPLTARCLVRRSSLYCRRTLLSTCLTSPA